ncbi:MAG: hypothetical protein AAGE80_04530 [Pseudomonadota bacterium]
MLEEYDLGATQLFDINLYRNPTLPLKDNPYAIVNCLEAKECLVPDQSPVRAVRGTEYWRCSPPNLPNLTVRESASEGVDLWYDPLVRKQIFFSDRLARRLIEEGFTGINLFLLKTI